MGTETNTAGLSKLWIFCLVLAILVVPAAQSAADTEFSSYNDNFETFDESLWDRAQYTFNEAQLKDFKLGDLEIDADSLKLTTAPGAFSKTGIASRFVFRGDFDIQFDCRFVFKALRGMDQLTSMTISNKVEGNGAWQVAIIRLEKKASMTSPRMIFVTAKDSKAVTYKYRETGDFHGTLRMVREGKKITGLYRREGAKRWHKLGYSSRFTDEDVLIGFVLQNFWMKRKNIKAQEPLEVVIDNFKINHAVEIIEDEI